MLGCCGYDVKFEGVLDDYKWWFWIVIVLNVIMFGVEMIVGYVVKF